MKHLKGVGCRLTWQIIRPHLCRPAALALPGANLSIDEKQNPYTILPTQALPLWGEDTSAQRLNVSA